MEYYNWQKLFSFQTGTNGEIAFIVGARGIGKTYGLRKQCIKDFIKTGAQFIEIVRTNSELEGANSIITNYFAKIESNKEFPDYMFMIKGKIGYISKQLNKPEWQPLVYFVALSTFQNIKKRTFANIKRIIFDEVVIDKRAKYSRYLPAEYTILTDMIDTITRENANQQSKFKPRLYLLANACDFGSCPYFQALEIFNVPDFGYHWYKSKTVIFHYVEPTNAEERLTNTLVGRMLNGYEEAEISFNNTFGNADMSYIEKKSSKAKYMYGIAYKKARFGVWLDYGIGKTYINRTIPNNNENTIFSLSTQDNKIDYIIARRSEAQLKQLIDIFYLGALFYDSVATREMFLQVLALFGIR